MNPLKTIWLKLRSLGRRRAVKQEIDEELRFHIERRTAENISAGMSPEEAAREARTRFGNVQTVREQCRERCGANFAEEMWQDLRFGARQLRKNPGFTGVAVLTLALGIGACTAMFSLINAVLLRPLPFRNSGRLVWIENVGTGGMSERTTRVDNFLEWRSQNKSFEELAAYFAFFDYERYTLIGSGEPQRLRGVGISKNLLDVLGVTPWLGRGFTDEECAWNGRKAVMLTHSFWDQHFAGDTTVIGRSINLNGDPTEIVGVLPASFDFDSVFAPGTKVELLLPFPLTSETARWGNTLFAIGRLKPAVTIEQVRAEFEIICQRVVQAHPERGSFGARLTALDTSIRGNFRQPMFMLFGAVGCVLLIACVNLSNLLLSRANARRQEFAVRVALGASRWRLIRQTLTESLLLALGGCALGVPLAFATTAVLARLQTFNIPLLQTASVDKTALAFTVAIAGLAGLLSGMLPAVQLSRGSAGNRLNAVGSRGTGGGAATLVRKALVITEIALACVLLVGAGLLIQSFAKLLAVNLGFQPKQAAAWRVDPPRSFKSLLEKGQYYDHLLNRIASMPGVESVGFSDALPLGRNRTWGVGAKGVSYAKGAYPIAFVRLVSHQYLQTMQIPLRAGRFFEESDTADSEKVIVINETMARTLWPGRDPLGQIVEVNGESRVVGVVGDVRHSKLEEPGRAEFYLSYRQSDDWNAAELVVRTTRPIASLARDMRVVMKDFDPTLPSTEFITLSGIVDQAVAPRRLITSLLGAFSALALLLSAIGLYGVIAYSVAQRTREIGIRLAVGAQRGQVVNMIVGEGLRMAAAGVALGLVACLLLTRVLGSLLYGVTATDPLVFAANAAILVIVALLACAIPARRAASVDPMEALRHE
jgi:putative ABC transport system permease protein